MTAMLQRAAVSRRDAFLILLGAVCMQLWSFAFHPSSQNAIVITESPTPSLSLKLPSVDPLSGTPHALTSLPHTSIVAHAPGWTVFQNLYMSNGTLLLLSPSKEVFPGIRLMTSTGLAAQNSPENIREREPTKENMDFVTPEQAQQRWGSTDGKSYRIWSIKGNTILHNDPPQFLHHYFHFVAELFFGTWAFWLGAFTQPSPSPSFALSLSLHLNASYPPPIHRVIFTHSDPEGWHDTPGFDGYFLRAAFPSLTVESQMGWNDLISATRPSSNSNSTSKADQRAWHFPYALLSDRSAAHRGVVCGSRTQRTASEAWQFMLTQNRLVGVHAGRWWDPVREAVWKFAGVQSGDAVRWMKTIHEERVDQNGKDVERGGKQLVEVTPDLVRQGAFQSLLPHPSRITISYISRQPSRGRKLAPEAHAGLVKALQALVARRNQARTEDGQPEWELNIVAAEELNRDEQIQIAARTTIMLGIHGNGLTHLVFMPPTRVSTVIEIFYPKGFAHDYQWTSTALGMKHIGVWNDTYFTLPAKEPRVNYPPGFHDDKIPVHGPSVAKLIEDRVDGKLAISESDTA
ncbi:hypothetical protein APHAL10511_007623 [Amanita phalloides]|nr:hypothetical protein APHAL10511_007623 [Amanita phalloides]